MAPTIPIIRLIVTPLLWPTITVVGTTMIINALKTFDIVYVMTNGAYDTDVIATQMFRQLSTAHYGRGAAVGVVLFIAIVPLLSSTSVASNNRRSSDERRAGDMARTPRRERLDPGQVGCRLQRLPLHVMIIIFCAIWVFPRGPDGQLLPLISDMGQPAGGPTLFPPHGFTFSSYQQVLIPGRCFPIDLNSLLITLPATVIQLAIATMGAYAFAWMNFPGRNSFSSSSSA